MENKKKSLGNLQDLGIFLADDQASQSPVCKKVIPTGSLMLDIALGTGGWPEGKIIELFGVDSSGKTTLALHAVAEAQKQGKTIIYMDLENTLNSVWAKKIGVDISKLLVSKPANGERAFEILNNLVERGDIGLIVVDSVASLVPSYEFENNIEDQTMGLHARLMSKGLRILQAKLINSQTTIIFINQVRDKIGNSYLPSTITTGGRALRYAACMRVEVKRCESIKSSSDEVIGFVTRCVVVKNKYGAPLVSVNSAIYFDSGFDVVYEILREALQRKIILQKGSWFEFKNKNIANGFSQLRNKIRESMEMCEEVKKLTFSQL